MSKEKQKKSLLDLITAENLQEVNSDKKGLEELTKRFNEVTEFLFATDEVQKVLKEKDQKISDLEAKLAEKDRQLKVMRELKNRYLNYYKTCETECSQLKQQLAEKDEEIEYYKTLLKRQCDECKHNRDKILFAVEKLEEVKHYAQHIQGGLINYIENQIKQLKEMK